jgi:hypothetical protein
MPFSTPQKLPPNVANTLASMNADDPAQCDMELQFPLEL